MSAPLIRTLRMLLLGAVALSTTAFAQEQGYIELDDGIGLRYTVLLPEGEGPFPVLLQYQGYGAGSSPNDNGIVLVSERWLELGFAILGVNLRGTGCSEGDFDLFEDQWIDDGLQVLDWAAVQPWSNGDIAMVGLSFPAMTQMMIGPMPHPALKALMPWSAMTDLYRDVGWPGGIYNLSFATGWTAIQRSGYQYLRNEIPAGNTRCLAAIPTQNDPERIVFVFGQTHPWAEHFVYERFVPEGSLSRIDIPVLISHGWQDEQIGSRATVDYEQLDPARTWHVYGNGAHGFGLGSPTVVATAEAFLRHFMLGEDNGFEATPHVQIEHENAFGAEPRWLSQYPAWPVPTRNAELYFQPDGSLDARRPQADAGFDYVYPLPAPSMTSAAAAQTENQTYALPVPPGGSAIFTTPALSHDLEILGSSRVDLWLSSTATDTDLQLSLTEVRPDGQEMFVQRGWLRASKRAMDMRENRANVPWHWFSEATAKPLEPGVPTPLSIEIWSVNHVFRAGSALRLRVEAPLGTTGFRQLELNPTPALNTVHVGPARLSRITLPVLPGGSAPLDYPPCSDQINQPCRASDTAVPAGELSVPAAQPSAPSSTGRAVTSRTGLRLHNTASGTHYLRAVTLRLPDAHQLHAATLRLGEVAVRIESPRVLSRFELPEHGLAPGASVELMLHTEEQGKAGTVLASLAGLARAHPGHGQPEPHVHPSAPYGAIAVMVWLLLAPFLARRRRWIGLLVLSGVLVSCGGGRGAADPAEADSRALARFELQAVEVVDERGQFQRYTLR